MTETATILRQETASGRVISFSRFMELALYCPNSGYYERPEVAKAPGRRGDFITSVSVGRLFGELLAFQFSHWLDQIGSVDLIEAGAHDGRLAADILGWIREHRPELWGRVRYWLVEPSARRQEWQRTILDNFAGRVTWLPDLTELRNHPVAGILFSNELLDALPVKRLAWDAARREWCEWGVGLEDNRWVWRRMPLDEPAAWGRELSRMGLEISPELLAVLPDGFTLDVCPVAGDWWRQAAAVLRRGWLLTFDYGMTAPELLLPQRTGGTLRAYSRHRPHRDVLSDPGTQDLTAHVNFTQLQRAGEESGLATEGLFSQEQFLTRVATELWREQGPSPEQARQFQTLTHPEHFGRSFRVLVQSRRGGGEESDE